MQYGLPFFRGVFPFQPSSILLWGISEIKYVNTNSTDLHDFKNFPE